MDQDLINSDQPAGKRAEIKGKVTARWRDLTDHEAAEAEGKLEGLAGRLHQRYGGARFDRRRGIYRKEEAST